MTLPVDGLRDELVPALDEVPVVLTSPTGSGKSTQVPRWLGGKEGRRVLVVEPRRVACRSLAQRVAELEGVALGREVGYHVRDEPRRSETTRILFATPGVVLRMDDAFDWDVLVLDEFHERRLDVDLLLALARQRAGRLVVMSATLDGAGLARHLDGRHLHAEGRMFPVDVRHVAGPTLLPDASGLEERVEEALDTSRGHDGDVLVFLPGKGEIGTCADRLRRRRDLAVLELHGGLGLKEQSRAFLPAAKRKVILATNVAETSITVPGVGVVIDSGLVRRTRYHRGRGHLVLAPIAFDSAEQRAGRAGRTGPGLVLRLWSREALLEKTTPPEMHRESLVPLVLAAAACGERVEELVFFDPPRDHALETARDELRALGALDDHGRLTGGGRQLFGLPLDPALGRWLIEARQQDDPALLEDVADLVAILAVDRPWFRGPPPSDDGDDEVVASCDAVLLLRALRRPEDASSPALQEIRTVRRRLRHLCQLPERPPADGGRDVDRRRLARLLLAADPRAAHVARRRGRRMGWSNGGTELELGRDSAANRAEDAAALVVLDTHAVGKGRDLRTLITCAMPVPLAWLVEAGLGRDRLAEVHRDGGRVVARIERVHARKVLATREEVPAGELARRALVDLFLRGSIFRDSLEATRDRLKAAALARRLADSDEGACTWGDEVRELYPGAVPGIEDWAASRVAALGVESGDDLALLAAEDLLAPDLPPHVREELDREMPRALTVRGTVYEIDYDLGRREAVLHRTGGSRPKEPPPAFYLPRLRGFRVLVEHKGTRRTLRG